MKPKFINIHKSGNILHLINITVGPAHMFSTTSLDPPPPLISTDTLYLVQPAAIDWPHRMASTTREPRPGQNRATSMAIIIIKGVVSRRVMRGSWRVFLGVWCLDEWLVDLRPKHSWRGPCPSTLPLLLNGSSFERGGGTWNFYLAFGAGVSPSLSCSRSFVIYYNFRPNQRWLKKNLCFWWKGFFFKPSKVSWAIRKSNSLFDVDNLKCFYHSLLNNNV